MLLHGQLHGIPKPSLNRKPCTFARRAPQRRAADVKSQASTAQKELTSDVVVVGGGIIGLLTAQQLLKKGLSVTLVERQQLCAGATGAGQGYIWMSHRSVASPAWELAASSTRMWHDLVQLDPAFKQGIEWQDTGSLLLGSSTQEAEVLEARSHMLHLNQVPAQLLTADEVMVLEPAVKLPAEGAGLLAKGDAQINGRRTAAVLMDRCRAFGPAFQAFLDEPVESIQAGGKSSSGSGSHAVMTAQHRLQARVATVVAAGVWTGQLLAQATGRHLWQHAFTPRRGHLLELERPAGMPALHTGMMEVSYTKHYANPGGSGGRHDKDEVDITFTATTSAKGTILLGSSREQGQMDKTASPQIVKAIMQRAEQFLPGLKGCPPLSGEAVRVGPRPYAEGGLPYIGPVPEHPGLYVAAGHEGSGLCLGPATAQLISHYITPERGTAAEVAAGKAWAQELLPKQRLAYLAQQV